MNDTRFTDPDTWLGGFYELAIELGPPSNDRLGNALLAVWSFEGIDGPFSRHDVPPAEQPRVTPLLGIEGYAHVYGVATFPDGRAFACGTVPVREEEGSDWLVFYIPTGALDLVYDASAFLFGKAGSSAAWQGPLDDWLARLAESVFDRVPFPLALTGHEVSGLVYAKEIEVGGIPTERRGGYLWAENGSLKWYRPTNYG